MWPAPGISMDSITAVTGLGLGRSVRKNDSPTETGGGPTEVTPATAVVIGLRPGYTYSTTPAVEVRTVSVPCSTIRARCRSAVRTEIRPRYATWAAVTGTSVSNSTFKTSCSNSSKSMADFQRLAYDRCRGSLRRSEEHT